MTHEEFIEQYNAMIRPDVDPMTGRPLPLEELSPEVLAELMPMIVDMMNANCGSVHDFDFVGNNGHIKLVGGKHEEH